MALAAVLAACAPLSLASAQTGAGDRIAIRAGDLADPSDLRGGSEQGLADELRRDGTLSGETFTPGDDLSPYEPFGRGSEDLRDRSDGFDEPAIEDVIDADQDVEPSFDLFEGPDSQAPGRLNPAVTPATAAGAVLDPATAPNRSPSTQGQGNPQPDDPLLATEQGARTNGAFRLPAGPVRGRNVDVAFGRANLPITGLRQAIPLATDDPFAPIGVRVGRFVLYSTLEQSVGASSNLSNSTNGRSGVFSDTVLSGRLISDWSRHQAEFNGLAAYRRNFAGEVESEPRVALDGNVRLDIDRLTTATLRGAFVYEPEDPIDLDSLDLASDRADTFTYSAGAGLERRLGRFALGVDADAVRETTSEKAFSGASAADENYTTYTAAFRTGYEISPALEPFVQGSVGRRLFDESAGLSGTSRDSVIPALRAGLSFDLGEKLSGEAAAGYAWNVPDAAGLSSTASPTIDARVAWSPQRGTDLIFSAVTSFDPDTEGSSSSTLYETAVAARHRATARTDLNATVSAAYRDSDIKADRETSYAVEAGFSYWLNRSLAFTGLLRHERLDGEAAGSDYTANSARIGIRVQR